MPTKKGWVWIYTEQEHQAVGRRPGESQDWVVVVFDGYGVVTVFGPRQTRLEAEAIKNVIRIRRECRAEVCQLREVGVAEVHFDGVNR